MSDEIKVHDKRMFTPDGELREEYRDLEDRDAEGERGETGEEVEPQSGESADAGARRVTTDLSGEPESADRDARAPIDMPETGAEEAPGFLDLLAVVAEPVALYLGDAELPDGRSMENLDMARAHIDLLGVLKEKTEGNLTPEEESVIDDILYRLRMRYVQKRG